MALKFRRGTTAQQSGSLAFGEPFVNTTLGTLLVGGPNGDIVLSTSGTGSTGNFGAISGSGLDITGNANIAGNLTLGGAITIGDASADTINVIASVSSSIIPSVTNAFDLGSENYFWRDIYVSTGSIKFVGAAGTVVGTLTNIGNGLNLDAGIVTKGDSSFGTSSLAITSVTGSLRVSGSLNVIGGINGVINATNGVVSGSSQVIGILDSLNTFSGSALTRFTEIGVVSGSLITSASAAKTTNDSQDVSITNLNSTTASLNTSVSNLNSFTSSINTTIKSKLDADGVVSGSSQITLSSTTGFSAYSTSVDSRIATEKGRVDAILLAADADKDSFAEIVTLINSVDTTNDTAFASFYTSSTGRLNNLESTSASVNTSVSNLNSTTASLNTSVSNLNSTTASLLIETANLETFSSSALTRLTSLESASGSAISRLSALEVETANLESFTSSINTTIKSKLDADGVISSSAQLTTTFDSRYLNTGGDGVVSGSAQIDVASTTGDIALGTRTSGNYVASLVAGTNITLTNNSGEGATPTIGLTNNAITIAGTSTSLGGSITAATILAGTGVVSGSAQIDVASTTGDIALGTRTSGNYVATITAGTGVSSTGTTTGEGIAHTISIGQAVATSSNVQFNSLGVGMAASATAGRIDATNDIVAFSSSDIRFKENIKPIENPIEKIRKISGNTYDWKEENKIEHGYEGNDVGVIAQEIEAVLPQLVQTRESGYKAVKYDKLVALLIEGIKEQQLQIEQLRIDLNNCRNNKGL